MTFPETRLSLLEGLRSGDQATRTRSGDLLVRAYRGPVLGDLTWRWRLEPSDAEDVVQDFFMVALEKGWFDHFDPGRGRFRSFVRMAARRYAANWHSAASRQRRGGGIVFSDVADETVVGEDGDSEAEQRFRHEWIRSVFELALDSLREEAVADDRSIHLAIFEAYDLSDDPARPTYADLGREHQLGDSQVINHLAWARRRFRSHVLDVLRRLAGSDAEYREDVRELLGIDAP